MGICGSTIVKMVDGHSGMHADLAKGAKQHALAFSTLGDVRRVDAALDALSSGVAGVGGVAPSKPLITVVGAGFAGVELAATIAERLPGATVHLLSPSGEVLPVRSSAHTVAESSLLQRAHAC
jgi:NADH dehydrogenase FAD-containing subunit